MPMYDFYCAKCDHTFEELSFGEENVPCPHCGETAERRLAMPSPLKTGAFPYKIGPVQPMAPNAGAACSMGGG